MLLLCLTLLTAAPEAEAAAAPTAAPEAAAPAVEKPAADKPAEKPALDEPSSRRDEPKPTLFDEPKLDAQPPPGEDPSLGWTLIRTIVVLGLVVMLAYVSLNWGMRKMLGIRMPAAGGGLISIIERVPLDQRRSMFVVKAAGEYLLIGGAEQSLNLISKLDPAEVEKLQAAQRAAQPALTLSPFLQKLLGKGKS
jgi:flagellar protein FliO/FliZ